jgi:hypothetical protein
MNKFSRKLQKLHETAPKEETAILVTLIRQQQSDQEVEEHLDELAFWLRLLVPRLSTDSLNGWKNPRSKHMLVLEN